MPLIFPSAGREDALLDEGYMGDSDDGIITRSVMYLFEQLAGRSSGAGGDGCQYSLRVSFAEVSGWDCLGLKVGGFWAVGGSAADQLSLGLECGRD